MMKKNIKLTAKQTEMVVDKMSSFKNDIFDKVNAEMTQTGGTALAAPFNQTFIKGSWLRSA